MSNLEPIEESDLDLKSKFFGKTESLIKNEEKKEPAALEAKEIVNPEFLEEKKEVAEERSIEKEKTYSKILSKVKTSQGSTDEPADTVEVDAKDTAETATAEAKIDKLVKLAMTKGIVHAVKVAKHMEDNYVLDEFHDKLMAEEFHNALLEKGIIQEL